MSMDQHVRRDPAATPTWAAALSGALAGGVAVAVSELAAGMVSAVPSLVVAIGSAAIALQPPGAKDIVVALFGTNDKLALQILVVVAAIAVAALVGVGASRRFVLGAAAFVAAGIVAGIAAIAQPGVSAAGALVGASISTLAGIATLWLLLHVGSREARVAVAAAPAGPSPSAAAPAGPSPSVAAEAGGSHGPGDGPEWSRRRFLLASAGTLGVAVVTGAVGRDLIDAAHPADAVVASSKLPESVRAALPSLLPSGLPAPASAVPPLAADASVSVPGLTPIVVPTGDFYRIDTALLVPQVDVATWQLKVSGMVDHPLTFTYDDLLGMPLYEQYVTISCVSNEVGGHLVGNALWTGVRLKDVLETAGVRPEATQIVGRSVDGFTAGFPTAWAMAPEREPLIALGMDRQLLPADHGFPARLIVPGLYGYVSATKWLAEIQLTTREAFDGYWVPLGWAKDAPILTQSRIDVPADGARLAAGPTTIAGLAWAPDRGIEKVEVRIDDGPWQAARLTRPISTATWLQWTLPWTAQPGSHTIEVRATDGTGTVQTADRSRPAPDGARGHHAISVQVG